MPASHFRLQNGQRRPGRSSAARTRWPCALAALIGAGAASASIACTGPLDERPYAQRLASAPLAFVGTVTAVAGSHVSFDVHHAINGSPGPSARVAALPPSTCAIAFAVGQRWLYAGSGASQPSVLLLADARGAPASQFGRLQRTDDARAQFPAAWQACTSNAQCAHVPIGCRHTAVNAAHVATATAQSIRMLGDHRAMECAPPPIEVQALQAAQCVASRCGHWTVDLR